MATKLQIPDDVLIPGDLVDVYYQIKPGAPQGLVTTAIHEIKKSLASDSRFHYQGSKIEDRTNLEDNSVTPYLIVTLQVADPSKVTGNKPLATQPQQAGLWIPIVVLIALVTAAVVAYSVAVVYRNYVLNRHPVATTITSGAKTIGLGVVIVAIAGLAIMLSLHRGSD